MRKKKLFKKVFAVLLCLVTAIAFAVPASAVKTDDAVAGSETLVLTPIIPMQLMSCEQLNEMSEEELTELIADEACGESETVVLDAILPEQLMTDEELNEIQPMRYDPYSYCSNGQIKSFTTVDPDSCHDVQKACTHYSNGTDLETGMTVILPISAIPAVTRTAHRRLPIISCS